MVHRKRPHQIARQPLAQLIEFIGLTQRDQDGPSTIADHQLCRGIACRRLYIDPADFPETIGLKNGRLADAVGDHLADFARGCIHMDIDLAPAACKPQKIDRSGTEKHRSPHPQRAKVKPAHQGWQDQDPDTGRHKANAQKVGQNLKDHQIQRRTVSGADDISPRLGPDRKVLVLPAGPQHVEGDVIQTRHGSLHFVTIFL